MVEKVRESVGNYITQSLANKPYSGVIRALVVGDDSQISQAQWNVYLRTGVNHLMSICYLLKHNFLITIMFEAVVWIMAIFLLDVAIKMAALSLFC